MDPNSTVADVKWKLQCETDIEPSRQKLLGIPKTAVDDTVLLSIPPKPAGYSLILMGSTAAQLESVKETEDALKLRFVPFAEHWPFVCTPRANNTNCCARILQSKCRG